MRTLSRMEVFPVEVPIIRTFQFASGSAGQEGQKGSLVFVKVTDSEGAVGWGEGRPHPQWSYETLESVVSTIRAYLAPCLMGHEIWDRQGAHRKMFEAVGRGPSTGMPIAKAAVDLALHDLCARVAGVPLRCFLGGGTSPGEVALSWTLTAHSVEQMKDDIDEGLAAGFKHYNFKVGVDPDTDLEVARVIVDRVPPGGFIWADANQALHLHAAVAMAEAFREMGVHALEQPLPADQLHQMRTLRTKTSLPLAVDESSVSPADFYHYVRDGLVDYFVLKLTRSGGILPTLHQLGVAESAGLPMLVSGLCDGLLTKMAACQTAAAYGYPGPAGLNGSQFFDESVLFPDKARVEYDGSVHLGTEPGIGIQPDEDAVRSHLVQ